MMEHIICFAYDGRPATASFPVAGKYTPRDNEQFCTEEQAVRYGSFILRNGELVDIGDKPSQMHEWDGSGWTISSENAAIVLQNAQAEAIAAVSTKHAAMLSQLTGGASIEERDTWQLKLDAATASVAAGVPNDSAITLFHDEAAADEVSIMVKCERTILKSEAYVLLIGIASGIKTRAENAIESAQAPVDVRTALIQAATEAQAAAAQYLQMIGANK